MLDNEKYRNKMELSAFGSAFSCCLKLLPIFLIPCHCPWGVWPSWRVGVLDGASGQPFNQTREPTQMADKAFWSPNRRYDAGDQLE
jgi:hypothetical protein